MNEKKGGIERLRDELYSRVARARSAERRQLSGTEERVPESWAAPRAEEAPPLRPRVRILGPHAFFFASLAFFVASAAVASYLIFGGGNLVSTENVDIVVEGPPSIAGGDELVLSIGVVNKNAVPIDLVDLVVEYPPGTRAAGDINLDLPRSRESLGTIAPGARAERTVRARLFGEQNKEQEVALTVEYRVEGSNAIFYTEETYRIGLSSSPLSLAISAPRSAVSGQEVEFSVEVSSNATGVIPDVLLKAEYPFGFSVTDSSPAPVFGKDTFVLGDIPPTGKRTVRIRGTLAGEDGDERIFRFSAGTRSARDGNDVAAAFALATHPVLVEKPFLAVSVSVNGDPSPEYVAAAGKSVRVDVEWTNNLDTRILDPEIAVTLAGAALDTGSVSPDRGFYRSFDRTVIWNEGTDQNFEAIEPGESGRVSFSFAPLSAASAGSITNPAIGLSVSVRGRRTSETGVPESLVSSAARTVKVAASLGLSSRAAYAGGPVPPKAEQATSYTVTWGVSGIFNPVDNAVVRATLPLSVSWLGVVGSGGEGVSFNSANREVVWRAGSLSPKGGIREASFRVSLVPSVSQVGSVPELVSEQTFSATDQFTERIVTVTRPALTTDLTTEAGFSRESAVVIP